MNVYNFFKFLEKKDGRKVPLIVKLRIAPETVAPEDLHVKGDFNLTYEGVDEETSINLPNNMIIDGNMSIQGVSFDDGLPRGLIIKKDLEISTTNISELPSDIRVDGDVYIDSEDLTETYETPRAVKQACPGIKGKVYMSEL